MSSRHESLLHYAKGRRSQGLIKRHYILWRTERNPPMPLQCDNPRCLLHDGPLMWNGKAITLILDHKNGVNGDNQPNNPRLLCPNCNSQQPTQGGKNIGRVVQFTGCYGRRRDNGKLDYTMPAEQGHFRITDLSTGVAIKKKQSFT